MNIKAKIGRKRPYLKFFAFFSKIRNNKIKSHNDHSIILNREKNGQSLVPTNIVTHGIY